MKRICTLILPMVFTGILSAQELTLDKVLSYRFPSQLVASPSSEAVAWVENKEGVRNIFTASSPDFETVQVTPYFEDDGQELTNLVFTSTNDAIVFVRGGAPNRQGEYPNPRSSADGYKREIYITPFETGFPRLLDEGYAPLVSDSTIFYLKNGSPWSMDLEGENQEQLFGVRGGVTQMRLSPDGTRLAFTNTRGDHSFIGVFHLYERSLTFPDPGIDLDSDPVWSPDGGQIAFIRIPHEELEIFVPQRQALPFSVRITKADGTGSNEVWKADEGRGSVFRNISADNQLFWMDQGVLVFPWEKNGWTQLYSVSVSGGNANNLTPGEFEVQYVSQSPDRKFLSYSGNQDDIDRQHIWRVEPGKDPTLLTGGKGVEWSPVIDASGNVALIGSDGVTPATVKRISGGATLSVNEQENYPSEKLVEPKQVVFSAADGMKIHGQLFVPEDLKKNDKIPAVLFFHGGSRRQMLLGFHHRGYYHHAFAMNQYLTSRGYVVLSVNYRSGIGYGMEFREALNYGAGGASEFNDVLGAGLYLQNHPNVDGDNIGLWGGSYGGYLTALGLARASDLFKAGVDIHGVYDWNKVIKNFIPSYEPLAKPAFSELAYRSSPINFMEDWRSPVLLIHGDDDRNVPFSETVDKAEALRKNGVYFEQLVFPDDVHGFLLHSNWLKAYKATADFFDRMLKEK